MVYCNPSVISVSYLRTSPCFLYPWAATSIHPTVFTTGQSLGIKRKIWELNPAETPALINAKSPLCNLKSSLLEILKVPSLGTLWVTGKLWHNMFLISQKVLVQQGFYDGASCWMKVKDMLVPVLLSCERPDLDSSHLHGHLLFTAEHRFSAVHWDVSCAACRSNHSYTTNSYCLTNHSTAASEQEGPGFNSSEDLHMWSLNILPEFM